MKLEFNSSDHTYKLDGFNIPSVTAVINELCPIQYAPGDWYMQRGKAVHAVAAMIAMDIQFEHDERISGQVEALRKFFAEVQPKILMIERVVCSEVHRFAGTLDLFAEIDGKEVLVDYKSSLSIERVGLQLGGYSISLKAMGFDANYGVGVEIRENGTYSMTQMIKLKNYRREFLNLRATYGIRERMGLNLGDK